MPIVTECGISSSAEFHSLWKLPALPLTERFGRYSPEKDLAFDQELLISIPTGHVQLRNQLDPKILYSSNDYAFRTGDSNSSRRSVEFFFSYLKGHINGRTFRSAVDVGGNDLFAAKELVAIAKNTSVIDPICSDIDGSVVDGVKVYGKFIEDIDLSNDLPQPDLIICRHTLEHIANPRNLIDQWFQQCAPECLYVVEIPCFENLMESLRFDAIYHQHYHYFDLDTFKYLIWECGGEYLGHSYNRQGSCGGALIVTFRRAVAKQEKPRLNLADRVKTIQHRISLYQKQMHIIGELFSALPGPVYGYGASLMLATLGYHLGTNFARLDCILDDNPARDNTTYENIPVTVRHTANVSVIPNSSYIITSLESIRPIYSRILGLSPRRILVPCLI